MPRSIVSGVLQQGLFTRIIGRRIVHFQRLSSTMDEAVRQAEAGVEEGTVILAEEQTAGRGRFNRTWVSPKGNLYLSLVLYPSLPMLQYLSIIASVAVVRAIHKSTGLSPTIKWPNDVRINGKKVCGVLVENRIEGDRIAYAIVGIGVNVNSDPSTVEELAEIATSLCNEEGKKVPREVLLKHVLQEVDNLYQSLRKGDSSLEEWRGLLETLGKQVEVQWKDELHKGYAEDVDDVGNLLLRQPDGAVLKLPAGEVTFQK